MGTNSTVNLQKTFALRVKEFVGEAMYAKFLDLGIKIKHIKKICIKIGAQKVETFKITFLKFANMLIQSLERLISAKQTYSKNHINRIISNLFLGKSVEKV